MPGTDLSGSAAGQVLEEMICRYPVLAGIKEEITESVRLLEECSRNRGRLLLCGNGGSASDALHIAGELMKNFISRREIAPDTAQRLRELYPEEGAYLSRELEGAFPAIPLTGNTAFATAFANDAQEELSYAQQVYALGQEGDVLLGISTSGNAENVRYAAMTAKAKGMKVIGLTGKTGGRLKEYCDCCICVPETETYRIQELHLPVYHCICRMVEVTLWDS